MERDGCNTTMLKGRLFLQKRIRSNFSNAIRCRGSNIKSFLIDQELIEDQETRRKEIQLLLLGTKESGRNTMIKQLRIHFGDGYPLPVRRALIPVIIANLADAVSRVVLTLRESGREFEDEYAKDLATELLKNRPPDGYMSQSSMLHLCRNNSTVNEKDDYRDIFSNDEFQENGRGVFRQVSVSSLVRSTISNKNFEENSAFERLNALSSDINLFTMLTSDEILAKFDKEDPIIASAWLENYLEHVQFTDRKTAKVISIITDMIRYPHIRKLPPDLIAQLPASNEPPPPPPPPESSHPDLNSLLRTSSDDWSSTTISCIEQQNSTFLQESTSLQSNEFGCLIEKPNGLDFPTTYNDGAIVLENVHEVEAYRDRNQNVPFTAQLVSPRVNGRLFKTIIDQPEFQDFIKGTSISKQRLSTADNFFISNVDRVIQIDYTPTLHDILIVQIPSNAVRESVMQIGPSSIHLIDVGNQSGDIRKWIHMFESVNAVLFFSALTDYSTPSSSSKLKTAMDESVELFRFAFQSPYLCRKDFILFFTKKDLLLDTISNKSLSTAFPEFKGEDSPDACIRLFTDLFVVQQHGQIQCRIFPHFVCLLDIDEMKGVCQITLQAIFETNLRKYVLF